MADRGKFACAINCIDGRTQVPVTDWLSACLDVDFIDMVTEPGPDRVLASGSRSEIEAIHKRVMISMNAHHSKVVAIVAHHDCAANPVPKKEHLRFLEQCVKVVQSWGIPVRIITLWINEEWAVEVISDSEHKV